MEWRGTAILLSVRRHGETSAIIDVFSEEKGRHAGVVRGGASRKVAPILQPGAQLDVAWRARLEDHIGSFVVEPVRSRAAVVMGDRLALAGLNAVTSVLSFCLPEREAHDPLYRRTEQLLDLLGQNDVWPLAYLRWEAAWFSSRPRLDGPCRARAPGFGQTVCCRCQMCCVGLGMRQTLK